MTKELNEHKTAKYYLLKVTYRIQEDKETLDYGNPHPDNDVLFRSSIRPMYTGSKKTFSYNTVYTNQKRFKPATDFIMYVKESDQCESGMSYLQHFVQEYLERIAWRSNYIYEVMKDAATPVGPTYTNASKIKSYVKPQPILLDDIEAEAFKDDNPSDNDKPVKYTIPNPIVKLSANIVYTSKNTEDGKGTKNRPCKVRITERLPTKKELLKFKLNTPYNSQYEKRYHLSRRFWMFYERTDNESQEEAFMKLFNGALHYYESYWKLYHNLVELVKTKDFKKDLVDYRTEG